MVHMVIHGTHSQLSVKCAKTLEFWEYGMAFRTCPAKPNAMKPLLQYGPAGRLARQRDQHKAKDLCINEGAEKDARVREGVGLNGKGRIIPQLFAGYGNGPFLMPTLQLPR